MLDYTLYKEALAASGYTVIKTDELEQLRYECNLNLQAFQNEERNANILRAELAAANKALGEIRELIAPFVCKAVARWLSAHPAPRPVTIDPRD